MSNYYTVVIKKTYFDKYIVKADNESQAEDLVLWLDDNGDPSCLIEDEFLSDDEVEVNEINSIDDVVGYYTPAEKQDLIEVLVENYKQYMN